MIRRFGSSPKPVVARAHHHLAEVLAVDAQAVADAVVAREVRRRLGRRDEVVAGERRTRPSSGSAHSSTSAPSDSASSIAARTAALTPGSIPSASFISFGTPIRRPFRSSRRRQLDRRHVDGGRVVLVAAGDDRVEERAVAHVLRDGPDLVEGRGERDDAVARDGPVGRAQADVAAERARLLDRAAGVRAERPRREPGRDRGGRAAARAARDARRVPRVVRRPVGGVLGRRAHRELVRVRLAEQPQPALPCSCAATVASKTGT